MDVESFKLLLKEIVSQSNELKNKHTDENKAPVNYACIFSQTEKEYKEFQELAYSIGKIIEKTSTGPLFQIEPIKTVSGNLKILKIRVPDKSRPERGDADFTVSNYTLFKKKYISKEKFSLIERKDFEMVELMDADFNVRVYFSNPPVDEQLKIK